MSFPNARTPCNLERPDTRQVQPSIRNFSHCSLQYLHGEPCKHLLCAVTAAHGRTMCVPREGVVYLLIDLPTPQGVLKGVPEGVEYLGCVSDAMSAEVSA